MLHIRIDDYAHLPSPLHRWQARIKLIGLMILIFSIAFVQSIEVAPIFLLIALLLYALAGMPWSFLFSRLRAPGIFLLMVGVIFPFFSGETVIVEWGFVHLYQEGLLLFLLIAAKFVSILTLAILLFGTSPVLATIRAMQELGFPAILVDMLLMTYRYLFEIGHDFRKMQLAMRMKNFAPKTFEMKTLNQFASLAGTMLIRSYERSEKIYRAMILRGYGVNEANLRAQKTPATRFDWLWLGICGVLSVGILLLEFYYRGIL